MKPLTMLLIAGGAFLLMKKGPPKKDKVTPAETPDITVPPTPTSAPFWVDPGIVPSSVPAAPAPRKSRENLPPLDDSGHEQQEAADALIPAHETVEGVRRQPNLPPVSPDEQHRRDEAIGAAIDDFFRPNGNVELSKGIALDTYLGLGGADPNFATLVNAWTLADFEDLENF